MATQPVIPLARAADAMLARLTAVNDAPAIAALDGATLLGERAALMSAAVPGRTSAGGGCRLHDALDGTIALNLARPADRELLPALFADDRLDPADDHAIAMRIARSDAAALVARGREMGLAIAASRPRPHFPLPIAPTVRNAKAPPRVLDLAALWAGPLAAHLFHLAGAEVIKVESPARPDAMRAGHPDFYDLLNQGKASVALDPRGSADRAALLGLIAEADIVVEAARPRALLQFGIDADTLVRIRPDLIWLTITAHGIDGDAGNWVGFGDDVGVAAGLSAALHAAAGTIGFVGDAIADPLTGIAAALAGTAARAEGRGGRIGIAMVDVVATALAREQAQDPAGLQTDLRMWAGAVGRPFPAIRRRSAAPAAPFGSDRPRWRPRC